MSYQVNKELKHYASRMHHYSTYRINKKGKPEQPNNELNRWSNKIASYYISEVVIEDEPDWDYSAPHGAGRLMSRTKAKEVLKLEDFKKEMSNVYSTSVGQSTLDEAPMAYKPSEEIVELVKDTVDVIDIIKPLYNFKSN